MIKITMPVRVLKHCASLLDEVGVKSGFDDAAKPYGNKLVI
jgi:hypothetical protein